MAEEDSIEREDSGRKTEIARRIANVRMALDPTDIEIDTRKAIRLPLDQVPALGAALASLPEAVRTVAGTQTVTQALSMPHALMAYSETGELLDPSVLFTFNKSFGSLGSYKDAAGGLKHAHLVQATATSGEVQTVIQTASTLPYDPMSLFVAAAIVQINAKLDAIQETQEEMFEYLRQKDEAQRRGDLKTLTDLLDGYRNNWGNDTWRTNAHMKVLDIRQSADASTIHLRAQIQAKLTKKGLVESRLTLGARLGDVCDLMKEYQLTTYLYAFASFLEPMFSENFSEGNLAEVSQRINDHALQYRKFYTGCYNAIEASAEGSVDSALLGGASLVGKKLGEAIAATPLGERTRIDGALIGAGENVERFNDEQTVGLMARLREAKTPDVGPFKESVDEVNRLYNRPMRMFVDSESVYLVSEDEDSEAV